MSAIATSGAPSWSTSPTAGEASIAPRESPRGTSPLLKARPPVWSGSASPRTGQPFTSLPFERSACSVPSEVRKTGSLRLSPSTSASAGDEAPSLVSLRGKPGSVSASRWRNRLRRSCPVSVPLVTTTRTTKPVGSTVGRLFWCGPSGSVFSTGRDARPVKLVPEGKRAFSAAPFRLASVPSKRLVRALPLHQLEDTALKSAVLLGSEPGATSTLQVYECPRAYVWPRTAKLVLAGSMWSYQAGEVISASGGTFAAATPSSAFTMFTRPKP